jgi:hypothetical protein
MATSRKKTSSTTRSSKSVYFYPDQDAALLQAIAEAVDSGQVANFSELCKQALLQMLLTDQDPPLWDPPEPADPVDSLDSVDHGALWQSLEARIPQHQDPDEKGKKRLQKLEQDLKALSQRVDDLVDNLARIQLVEPKTPPAPKRLTPQDPLLQRLAPLLEEC